MYTSVRRCQSGDKRVHKNDLTSTRTMRLMEGCVRVNLNAKFADRSPLLWSAMVSLALTCRSPFYS